MPRSVQRVKPPRNWQRITGWCLTLLGGLALPARAAAAPQEPVRQERFEFETPSGQHLAARIWLPAAAEDAGWGVLMVGGGLGNDLDWTVAGELPTGEGGTRQWTISGDSHADAPILAAELAGRGFTVMHWSTLDRDDPLAQRWPLEATPRTPVELLELTRQARRAFAERTGLPASRTVLLGFSLGAARVAALEDASEAAAWVLLSPAYLVQRNAGDPRPAQRIADARQVLQRVAGRETASTAVSAFQAWRDRQHESVAAGWPEDVATMDVDQDGTLRDWELAGERARQQRVEGPAAQAAASIPGLPWTEKQIRAGGPPVLIVFGQLDSGQAWQLPVWLEHQRRQGWDHIHWRVVPQVGHNLGPVQEERWGPITEGVAGLVADWLEQVSARSPGRPAN